MYDLTQFELDFGTWLTSCLPSYEDKIITADQRNPALELPFVTFKVLAETPLNAVAAVVLTDEQPDDAEPGEYVESVSQTVRALVSVNIYGSTAFADAGRLVLEYQRFARVAQARALGFTVAFHEGIRRFVEATAIQDEQRAQIDFTVYVRRNLLTTNLAVSEIIGSPE